jgi:type VI secretion system protein VasJ
LKLTKEKSKDIRVLSFLSFAYLKNDQWEQFCDVFDGLTQLAEQNYDGLFPDRERAKQLAFKWLSEERFNALLTDKKPSEADYDHIVRCVSALTKLKPLLETKFPEGSPFPSGLYKSVQAWEKACKPKPQAPPPPSPPPQSATQAQQSADASVGTAGPAIQTTVTASSSVGAGNEPMDTPKQAQAVGKRVATFFIEKEPQKSTGFRLMRILRWELIEKAPPAENGKTQLQGPAAQQRTYFQNLLTQKDWKTALDKGEQAFSGSTNHLWIDLQRIIAVACAELGPQYKAIRDAVLWETALLIKRIPELTSMQFSDGTPFCDDATKDWIASEVNAVLSSGGASSQKSSARSDALAEETSKINALVVANQFEDALEIVQQGMRSSNSERDNFMRTVVIGSLLNKAKQPDIAISVLEGLDQKIELYKLERWDPDLAVEAWSTLVQAYKSGKNSKPQNIQLLIQEKQNTILSKISQIDPKKALILNK